MYILGIVNTPINLLQNGMTLTQLRPCMHNSLMSDRNILSQRSLQMTAICLIQFANISVTGCWIQLLNHTADICYKTLPILKSQPSERIAKRYGIISHPFYFHLSTNIFQVFTYNDILSNLTKCKRDKNSFQLWSCIHYLVLLLFFSLTLVQPRS